MPDMKVPEGCSAWHIDDPTKNPPVDRVFLETLTQAGYLTFIHEYGLCGGTSGSRSAILIHRGMLRRWEIGFQENDRDAVIIITMTRDLTEMTTTVLKWLAGGWLEVDDGALRGVVRGEPRQSRVR